MNTRNEIILNWAIKKVESEYKDDVSLLLTYGSYENGTANPLSDVDFYFIPKTERAYELCKTFIVEGIGYDLFPMSWERVEGLSELNESLTPCLANVRILYYSSEEDLSRLKGLQSKLQENLKNKGFMLEKAEDKLKTAMDIYRDMLFEENLCELRTMAGYIVMFLSECVAYSNQTYFRFGLKKQLEDLRKMESAPEDFVQLYESIVKSNSAVELKECCHKIILNTKSFISDKKPVEQAGSADFQQLAELYQEIISTWNKIYICCDNGNSVLAYISGTCLQYDLNMITRDYGLDKIDLMGFYDSSNLERFKNRAEEIQNYLVKIIKENGAVIKSYDSAQKFIEKN